MFSVHINVFVDRYDKYDKVRWPFKYKNVLCEDTVCVWEREKGVGEGERENWNGKKVQREKKWDKFLVKEDLVIKCIKANTYLYGI